jgi:hypothetical protein
MPKVRVEDLKLEQVVTGEDGGSVDTLQWVDDSTIKVTLRTGEGEDETHDRQLAPDAEVTIE